MDVLFLLARGIEQALILQYGLDNLENRINSISDSRDFYDEVVDWGKLWIKNNI